MTYTPPQKAIRATVWALALTLSVSVLGSAQNHAYVRRDTLLGLLPGYMAELRVLDSLQARFTEELDTERKKLDKKMTVLLAPYHPAPGETPESLAKRLSPTDAARHKLLAKEWELLHEKREHYTSILNERYRHSIQPLLNRLNSSIGRYAEQKNYDMVFILEDIEPALAYINTDRDITSAIIPLIQNSR